MLVGDSDSGIGSSFAVVAGSIIRALAAGFMDSIGGSLSLVSGGSLANSGSVMVSSCPGGLALAVL